MPEFSLIDELRLWKDVEDKVCGGNAGRIFWSCQPRAPGSNCNFINVMAKVMFLQTLRRLATNDGETDS